MASARRMGRPPGRTKDQTRTRIIESALLCFGSHGYGGTTNRMIADAAGLTNGALYRHFRTKADIYITTFMQTNGWMLERVSTAVTGAASLRETMLAVARVSSALITEKPSMAPFLTIVRMDIEHYPELSAIKDVPVLPTLGDATKTPGAADSVETMPEDQLRCYTEVMATLVNGAARHAILSDDPDDFAALMDKLERVLEAAGAQVRRSGTAVPGLDYSVISHSENAVGS
jgi:AcrR family transcriptional regulator